MPSHRLLALMCWLIQESVVTYVAASAAEACPSLLQLGQHMQVGSMSAGKVNNYIDNSSNNTINNNNKTTPRLFIAVITGPGYAARRAEVRASWMQDPLVRNSTVGARFIIGHPRNSTEAASKDWTDMENEAKQYGDFIRLNFTESYRNLTVKTVTLLRWFAREGEADFLLKLDDDTFPHFDRLMPRLESELSKAVFGGLLIKCMPVLRAGKWAVQESVMPQERYPVYANGPAYYLSKGLVSRLVEQNPKVDLEKLYLLGGEDVLVGMWLNSSVGMNEVVDYRPSPATFKGCSVGDVFSQNLQPDQMSCLWENSIINNNKSCCNNSTLWAPFGVGDWSLGLSENAKWMYASDIDAPCPPLSELEAAQWHVFGDLVAVSVFCC
ncbi:unnamed protein product [Polarella glacialis]|uniref:Hexosyltransferase n=1 Tax=Polarella glacialis TaxID=89957 RepID=A0A813L9I1_POLGL|nr:unnamed protein product [Polarella glacialis]